MQTGSSQRGHASHEPVRRGRTYPYETSPGCDCDRTMPEVCESFPEDADRTMPSGRPPAVQNGVRDPARQARRKTWARRAEWDSAGATNVERLLESQRIIVQPAVRKRTLPEHSVAFTQAWARTANTLPHSQESTRKGRRQTARTPRIVDQGKAGCRMICRAVFRWQRSEGARASAHSLGTSCFSFMPRDMLACSRRALRPLRVSKSANGSFGGFIRHWNGTGTALE